MKIAGRLLKLGFEFDYADMRRDHLSADNNVPGQFRFAAGSIARNLVAPLTKLFRELLGGSLVRKNDCEINGSGPGKVVAVVLQSPQRVSVGVIWEVGRHEDDAF